MLAAKQNGRSVTLAGHYCFYLMALQLDEVPTSTRARTRALNLLQRWLEHPRLPAMLALGAVLVMLPALNLSLLMDNLVQRLIAPGKICPC